MCVCEGGRERERLSRSEMTWPRPPTCHIMKSCLFSGRNSVTPIFFKLVIQETAGPLRRSLSLSHLFNFTHICDHKGYYTTRLINQLPTGTFTFPISSVRLIYSPPLLAQFHRGDDAGGMPATCRRSMCSVCHI